MMKLNSGKEVGWKEFGFESSLDSDAHECEECGGEVNFECYDDSAKAKEALIGYCNKCQIEYIAEIKAVNVVSRRC